VKFGGLFPDPLRRPSVAAGPALEPARPWAAVHSRDVAHHAVAADEDDAARQRNATLGRRSLDARPSPHSLQPIAATPDRFALAATRFDLASATLGLAHATPCFAAMRQLTHAGHEPVVTSYERRRLYAVERRLG
jgi:hypothetical protein